MKRHRHTPEQAVRKLYEGQRMLDGGKNLTEVAAASRDRRIDLEPVAEPVRRDEHGRARQLKELQVENARLKKLLADRRRPRK